MNAKELKKLVGQDVALADRPMAWGSPARQETRVKLVAVLDGVKRPRHGGYPDNCIVEYHGDHLPTKQQAVERRLNHIVRTTNNMLERQDEPPLDEDSIARVRADLEGDQTRQKIGMPYQGLRVHVYSGRITRAWADKMAEIESLRAANADKLRAFEAEDKRNRERLANLSMPDWLRHQVEASARSLRVKYDDGEYLLSDHGVVLSVGQILDLMEGV